MARLWTDVIDPETLSGFARRSLQEYEAAKGSLARWLPNKEVADQVEVLQRCAELTVEAVPRLRTMSDLHEYCIEINRLENAGDKSFRSILALLFGGAYDALEVLRLKDVVEALEAAIDGFETVAELVEQVQAKNG